MSQSEKYKYLEIVDHVGGIVGADYEGDQLRVRVVESDTLTVDVVDEIDRLLGQVRPYEGSVWTIQEATPIDVTAETVPIEQTETVDVAQTETVTVQEADPLALAPVEIEADPHHDRAEWDAEILSAQEESTRSLRTDGADRLRGRVVSDNQYSVEIDWLAADDSILFTDTIAEGEPGGVATDLDELAVSPDADVRVIENADEESEVTGVAHLS